MTKEDVLENQVQEALRIEFATRFPQCFVSVEYPIQFGANNYGSADLVLSEPINHKKGGKFVAIVECKRAPLQGAKLNQAIEQLKSYMTSTHTLFGVLAMGRDDRNWKYYENRDNSFKPISRMDFENGVSSSRSNLPEVTAAQTEVADLRSEVADLSSRLSWWKRGLYLLLFPLVVVSFVLGVWMRPNFPEPIYQTPEPIVYITRTGKKYHTYDCNFLRKYNIKNKFAILLNKAEKDYDPCGICNPKP